MALNLCISALKTQAADSLVIFGGLSYGFWVKRKQASVFTSPGCLFYEPGRGIVKHVHGLRTLS